MRVVCSVLYDSSNALRYGMANVDLYSAIVIKVSNALCADLIIYTATKLYYIDTPLSSRGISHNVTKDNQ